MEVHSGLSLCGHDIDDLLLKPIERELKLLQLISFLIVSACINEEEWENWGMPFIKLLADGIIL